MGFAAPNQVTDAILANPGDTNRLGESFARYRCRATITGSTLWKAGPFCGRKNEESSFALPIGLCKHCCQDNEGLRCEARLELRVPQIRSWRFPCSRRLASSRK